MGVAADCRNVGIKQLVIGGEMAHWKTPVREESKVMTPPGMRSPANQSHL